MKHPDGLSIGAVVVASALSWAATSTAMDIKELALLTDGFGVALREEVLAMSYLLTDDELRDLLAYRSVGRCERWLDEWWREHDPVYTTPENESRAEFQERVERARETYRTAAWPGWDQRGEVLIRYGAPSARQSIPASVDYAGINRARKVWYYHSHGMIVLFEDSSGDGRYTYMIVQSPSVGAAAPAGARTRGMKAIDAAFDDVIRLPDPAAKMGAEDFAKRVLHFSELLATQPAMFHADLPESRLPVDTSVECFRGGDGVDRVDVNAAFTAAGGEAKYVTTAVFFNSDGDEVQRNVNTTVVPASSGDAPPALLMSQLRFTLPPDFYHVAVTVEEFGTGRFSSTRTDKPCESFDGRLAISDLMFATRIAPVETESVFNRGSLYVLPHPARRYREGQPIPLYFEVYNLALGRNGRASYTVAYRLTANTPRPAGFLGLSSDTTPLDVESRFTSTSSGSDDVVDITLQSGNLWKGSYTLDVTIADDVSDRQVSRRVTFEISE